VHHITARTASGGKIGIGSRFDELDRVFYHIRMSKHVALLRGINVSGRNKIAMADLRQLAESLGLGEPRTLLQSGNLVVDAGRRTTAALEKLLETETSKRLGVAVDFMVRTAVEWHAIVAANPFPKEAKSDPSHLVVLCLKNAPKGDDVKALQADIKGPEVVRCAGRELFAVYPAGIGDSKLTNAMIEKRLGTRGTGRNWNTVLKLEAMLVKVT